jgi:hypothetical protein
VSRFLREVYLDIGSPGTTGKRYRGLRIRATVKMSSTSTPNEAQVELYNPSPDTITLAQRTGIRFRLWAGYGSSAALVFQGDAVPGGIKITPPGRDPTRVLRAELQDGGRAYRTSQVALSFAKGVAMSTVYGQVATAMGLDAGQVQLADALTLPTGLTFAGPARELLGRLAAISGAGASIRDGALYVVTQGGATKERAPLLTPATGLIGSPSQKDDGRVEVKALLDPAIRPLRPFRVESARVTGEFVAEDVTYRIDSRGQEFYAVATGRPR